MMILLKVGVAVVGVIIVVDKQLQLTPILCATVLSSSPKKKKKKKKKQVI